KMESLFPAKITLQSDPGVLHKPYNNRWGVINTNLMFEVLEKAARIGLGDAIVERYGCDVKVLVDACDVDGVYDVEEEDSDDDTLVLHKENDISFS
ncbi:hypothetical protein Tco_1305258, partial [Tanacetum coccineum]